MHARAFATTAARGRQDVQGFTRGGILHAVRDAWLNPIAAVGRLGRPGRPRERPDELVLKIAVFEEFHDDGLQTRTLSRHNEFSRVVSWWPHLLHLTVAALTFPCL